MEPNNLFKPPIDPERQDHLKVDTLPSFAPKTGGYTKACQALLAYGRGRTKVVCGALDPDSCKRKHPQYTQVNDGGECKYP